MTRRNFSKATIAERFKMCGGRCEQCNVALKGGDYDCDHVVADGLGGKPTLDNARILCRACHGIKTPGDVKKIAKVKRVEAKHLGVPDARKRKFRRP